MVFLGEQFQDELVWSIRCKDCGDLYVLRDVHAGEVRYPQIERILCHATGIQFEYLPNEFESVWAP